MGNSISKMVGNMGGERYTEQREKKNDTKHPSFFIFKWNGDGQAWGDNWQGVWFCFFGQYKKNGGKQWFFTCHTFIFKWYGDGQASMGA